MWDRFGRGDLDAALPRLHPNVRWREADDPGSGGLCRTRGDVVAFNRQALEGGVFAELLDVHEVGDQLVAVIPHPRTGRLGQAIRNHTASS